MKRFVLLFFLSAAFVSHGASVLWKEGFQLFEGPVGENQKGWWLRLSFWDQHEIYFDLLMEIETTGNGGGRKLFGSNLDLGRESWFVVADTGDEINAETSKDESRLFLTNKTWGRNAMPEYNATDGPWTLYLGFETTDSGVWTESDGWITPEHKIYGWVALTIDNYTMTLGDTCLDLSGRPVIVGVRSAEPIPEPTTGALALAGAALLFRRRPRRSSPRQSPPRCANTGYKAPTPTQSKPLPSPTPP